MFDLRFLSRLLAGAARPLVAKDILLSGYRAMAADIVREREAAEWVEAMIGD